MEGSGEKRQGLRNGGRASERLREFSSEEEGRGSEYTQHKAGWVGRRERKQKKIKEGCLNKPLATPDRDGSTCFTFPESHFLFSAESLPVVWLPSICLYSYNPGIRKENYFHISNSLNASVFVAGSECIVFTHLNAYLEALSAGTSRLGALLSCIWVSGWGGAVSESSIILHQCHHHLQGPSQWSVSHSGLTAGFQSPPSGGCALGSKDITYWLSFLLPVSSRKVSTFTFTRYIGDFALLHDNWSGSSQSKVRFALSLPKMMVSHHLKSNIGQFRKIIQGLSCTENILFFLALFTLVLTLQYQANVD